MTIGTGLVGIRGLGGFLMAKQASLLLTALAGVAAALGGCGGGGDGPTAAVVPSGQNPPPATLAASGKAIAIHIPDGNNLRVDARSSAGGQPLSLTEAADKSSASGISAGAVGIFTGDMTKSAAASADGVDSYQAGASSLIIVSRASDSDPLLNSKYGMALVANGDGTASIAGIHHGNPTGVMPAGAGVTATYEGLFMGVQTHQGKSAFTGLTPIVGNSRQTANFSAGTITGTVTGLQQNGDVRFGPASYGLATNGTISGNTYTGTVGFIDAAGTPAGNVTHSNLSGGFYGANAAETAGALAVSGSAPGTGNIDVVGAFGAVKK